jgi:hypothetical protein
VRSDWDRRELPIGSLTRPVYPTKKSAEMSRQAHHQRGDFNHSAQPRGPFHSIRLAQGGPAFISFFPFPKISGGTLALSCGQKTAEAQATPQKTSDPFAESLVSESPCYGAGSLVFTMFRWLQSIQLHSG